MSQFIHRQLSPYERTHLVRHGVDPNTIDEFGEQPVEYITGWVTFDTLELKVTQDVLIPRIETEELVALAALELQALARLRGNSPLKVADVGTGSGAIGLSLLRRAQLSAVPIDLHLSDVSEQALNVAKQNAQRLFPNIQMHWYLSNLCKNFPPAFQADLLVSNLPYIPSSRLATLDPSVKDFEPTVALDGGPQGLDLINGLLAQLPTRLSSYGIALLEVDHLHTEDHFKPTFPFGFTAEFIHDSFGQPRFIKVRRKVPT